MPNLTMTPTISTTFVNREEELLFIRRKFNDLKEKRRVFDFILLLSGIAGMGKTTLLEQIEQQAQDAQFEVIRIELSLQINQFDVLLYLASHYGITSGLLENYQGHGDSQDGLHKDKLAEFMAEHIREKLTQKPLILLLDDSHLLVEREQKILEGILSQLLDLNRIFMVVAGRADLRWKEFELNRRTRTVSLSPLPRKEAAKMATPGYAALNDTFYDLTKGYPIALAQAHEWAQAKFEATDPHKVDKVKEQEADLILELFNQTFVQLILTNISNVNIKARLAELIPLVSPLRRFDDYLLYKLLPELDSAMFGQVDTSEIRSYIRQMATHTYLVRWDSGKQAYSIDKNMRQLLTLNLKYRDIEKLKQIHQEAISWYKHTISEVDNKMHSSPQSVVYLIEQLYHCLNLYLLESSNDDLEHKAQEKIQKHFLNYELRERNHFFEEFKKDEDLQALLGDSYIHLVEFVGKQIDLVH